MTRRRAPFRALPLALAAFTSCGGAPLADVPAAPLHPDSLAAQRDVAAPRVLATELQGAWAVEGAVLIVKGTGGARRVARLDGDSVVDEELLSTGLPKRDEPCGTMGGQDLPIVATGLGGRWPDALVLALSCQGGFGRSKIYGWRGKRWELTKQWQADGDAVLEAPPAWQSGRGFLFVNANQIEGSPEQPAFLLDPIPSRPPNLVKDAMELPAGELRGSPTWVARDGRRATLVRGLDGNELATEGLDAPPKPTVKLAPPIYVRASGAIVAGVDEGPQDAPKPRVALCDGAGCTTSAPGPAAFVAFREVGDQLYGFSRDGAFRVLRLDGTQWTELAAAGIKDPVVAPVGEAQGGTLLLLVQAEGSHGFEGFSLVRWTPPPVSPR